jgi:protein-tyrosine-phosphatase
VVALPSAILFACSMNSVRSPMAEAIMKHLHGQRIFVDSVGVRPGEHDPFVDAVMDEIGIDITRHRVKIFEQLDDDYFDLIITLSPEAHHKALEMTRTMACDVEYWPTYDATAVDGSRETKLNAYRDVRDALLRRITERFARTPVADV